MDIGLKERGLDSLEGRRRLKAEKLPKDIEPSDVYVLSIFTLCVFDNYSFRTRRTAWLNSLLARHTPAASHEPVIIVVSHGAYKRLHSHGVEHYKYFEAFRLACRNLYMYIVDVFVLIIHPFLTLLSKPNRLTVRDL